MPPAPRPAAAPGTRNERFSIETARGRATPPTRCRAPPAHRAVCWNPRPDQASMGPARHRASSRTPDRQLADAGSGLPSPVHRAPADRSARGFAGRARTRAASVRQDHARRLASQPAPLLGRRRQCPRLPARRPAGGRWATGLGRAGATGTGSSRPGRDEQPSRRSERAPGLAGLVGPKYPAGNSRRTGRAAASGASAAPRAAAAASRGRAGRPASASAGDACRRARSPRSTPLRPPARLPGPTGPEELSPPERRMPGGPPARARRRPPAPPER